MSTIITRLGKGTALTWEEADTNFTNLNTDKVEYASLAADSGSSLVGFGTGKTLADLSGNSGASLVGYMPAGVGAVATDVQSKMRESVSVRDFGAVCDGVTDTDGAKIQAAVNSKAEQGGGFVLIPGIAVSTQTITVPEGVTLVGIGRGYNKKPISGILFKGTGVRSYSITNAISVSVANPDAGGVYLADSGTRGNNYSTIDFSASFSAAVILSPSSGLEDLAVLPWFDGVDGYIGTDNRMADSWDVGVWARNSSGWRLRNVMADGHWRKAGFLVSSSDLGDGKIPENELGEASFCLFGGARAVSIRTPRNAPVTNYGFAGTDFTNCYFKSFDHQSSHLATSSYLLEPQSTPSACLEMDGPQALRGVQFTNSTFVGRDDIIMLFGAVNEILFNGCYTESRSIKVNNSWLSNSLGSRVVATSESNSVFFRDLTKYGVDLSPYFTADSSLAGKRYANPGVFNPATSQDSEWERPNFSESYGTRLRNGQAWRIYNKDFNSVASISETGGLTVGRTAVTNPVDTDGNVFSGTYQPAPVIGTNVTAATASVLNYIRVGSMVFVSGQITVTTTAANVSSDVRIPLPIPSNLSFTTLSGTVGKTAVSTATISGGVVGDASNYEASVRFVSSATGSITYSVSFMYKK